VKEILILTELFFPEEYVINDLALSLKKKGYSVTVVTRNPSYPDGIIFPGYKNSFFNKYFYKEIKIIGLKFLNNYSKNIFFKGLNHCLYVFQSILFALFNRNKFDKILFYQTGPLTNGICLFFFSDKTPKSIWIQDLWPETINIFTSNKIVNIIALKVSKIIYSRISTFFISCEGFSQSLTSRFNVDKRNILYFPNWSLNNFDIPFKVNFDCNNIKILYAGNVGKFQELDKVLDSFVKAECNNLYFEILGSGINLKSLKSKYEDHPNIIFHNKVSIKKTELYFNRTDFLFLSLIKNVLFEVMMPSKVQTYLTTNRPIISVVSGYTNDFIKKHKLGYTADFSTDSSLIDLFLKISKIKQLDYLNFKSNFNVLENHFKKQNIINSFINYYEK
jgi:glycosyltransferase involved in cell wall biosynthesis